MALVGRRARWRFARELTVAVATLVVVGYVSVSIATWAQAPVETSDKKLAAYRLYSAKYQPDSILERLYANPQHARIYSSKLEAIGFNVFADPHIRPGDLLQISEKPRFTVETINGQPPTDAPISIDADGAFEVTGRAFNAAGTGPARALSLTIDGTRDLPAQSGLYTPTPIGYVSHRAADWAGFDGSFGGFVLTPGEHSIALKIVTDDGRHAYLTPVVARVIRR
jgi:hypothetical protein